jgi:hypothetical protein
MASQWAWSETPKPDGWLAADENGLADFECWLIRFEKAVLNQGAGVCD